MDQSLIPIGAIAEKRGRFGLSFAYEIALSK